MIKSGKQTTSNQSVDYTEDDKRHKCRFKPIHNNYVLND